MECCLLVEIRSPGTPEGSRIHRSLGCHPGTVRLAYGVRYGGAKTFLHARVRRGTPGNAAWGHGPLGRAPESQTPLSRAFPVGRASCSYSLVHIPLPLNAISVI